MSDDLGIFFGDFGVTAVYGSQSATVLLDMPDGDVLSGRMLSTGYAITYASDDLPGLAHGDSITVDGVVYTVNEVRSLDDGKLTHAGLQR